MTNEELCIQIQHGREDLYIELWNQVKGFVAKMAYRRYVLTDGRGGVTTEDLVQAGYIGLFEAVQRFDPSLGSFLTILGYTLKNAFNEAGGYRSTRQYNDPLNRCKSLDMPVGDDPDDDNTLMDLIPAEGDAYEDADGRIWLEQLHEALDRAVQDLPQNQKETICRRYYDGETLKEISQEDNVSIERVRQLEKRALETIRRRRRRYHLDEFAEQHKKQIDARTKWYLSVGSRRFNTTHASAVEELILRRERIAVEMYQNEIRLTNERDHMSHTPRARVEYYGTDRDPGANEDRNRSGSVGRRNDPGNEPDPPD